MVEVLEDAGTQVDVAILAEKQIAPCRGCYACQHVSGRYGCVQHDDMDAIVPQILAADCLIFATPIYSWYCTAPMKALMDRHYGLNKFYGKAAHESLWAGKPCGIVATCGYEIADGTGPFEQGIKRLCEHSGLPYIGMLAERDLDDRASFETPAAVDKSRRFGEHVLAWMGGGETGEFSC